MIDFTKTCWYCQAKAMEPRESHYECRDCGATWNEVCKLGGEILFTEKDEAAGLTKHRPSRRGVIGIGKKIRREKDATNI